MSNISIFLTTTLDMQINLFLLKFMVVFNFGRKKILERFKSFFSLIYQGDTILTDFKILYETFESFFTIRKP